MGKFPDNVYFKNYKCFKEYVGFKRITTSNVIIGKNNIGKSSLVDMLNILAINSYPREVKFKMDVIIEERLLRSTFEQSKSGGDIQGKNHWDAMGRYLVDREVTISTQDGWLPSFETGDEFATKAFKTQSGNAMLKAIVNPFQSYQVFRISAERDITKERADSGNLSINSNGVGATNYIQNVINLVSYDSSVIQDIMLKELNKILHPEVIIKNIVTQFDGNEWEVYFDDANNGRVALSKSGSGFKTVLLVLLNLIAIPRNSRLDPARCIYIFEELENNLHPALQRSLFNYIHKFAEENNSTVFYTTHSNVVIDLFSKFENAQLILMKNNNGVIIAEEVKDIFHKRTVFEELDVRASDLLQTNSIIWVEGPSDRIYINKWLTLIDDKGLVEGLHYQFMYYGGRLLSHFTTEEDLTDKLNLLKANRNSIIFIDSDKKKSSDRINESKRRIRDEFKTSGLICHITEGREIENYLNHRVLKAYFEKSSIPPLEKFGDIKDYLNNIERDLGKKFEGSKVKFADSICPLITIDDMKLTYGLFKLIEEVRDQIYLWNKL